MLSYNRNIIAIGGPKGVGKSTLIKSLHSYYPHIRIIPVGSELNRLARKTFHVPFLSLPLRDQGRIRKLFFHHVLEMNDSILLDMHFGEFEDEGYPCLIPSLFQKHITHCILITASPKTIWLRRHVRFSVSRLDIPSIVLNIYGEKMIYQELLKRHRLLGLVVKNEDKKNSILIIKKFFKRVGII